MASISPINMNELGNQVRHWVHFDNLLTNLNKQIQSTRTTKQSYENTIIQTLKTTNHEKAVLQIAGGRILLVEEKHTKPLTFTSLELMLNEYYRQRGSPGKDETQDIIKFIKGYRTLEVTPKLKRQITDKQKQ